MIFCFGCNRSIHITTIFRYEEHQTSFCRKWNNETIQVVATLGNDHVLFREMLTDLDVGGRVRDKETVAFLLENWGGPLEKK